MIDREIMTTAAAWRHNKGTVVGLGSLLCVLALLTIVWPKLKLALWHQYPESKLAHKLLDGMKGIEIGASLHNPFCLNTLNVDYTNQMDVFRQVCLHCVCQ